VQDRQRLRRPQDHPRELGHKRELRRGVPLKVVVMLFCNIWYFLFFGYEIRISENTHFAPGFLFTPYNRKNHQTPSSAPLPNSTSSTNFRTTSLYSLTSASRSHSARPRHTHPKRVAGSCSSSSTFSPSVRTTNSHLSSPRRLSLRWKSACGGVGVRRRPMIIGVGKSGCAWWLSSNGFGVWTVV
jgi:hypothetical protein